MLMRGREFLKCYDSAPLWQSYQVAMDKRRPGSALPHNSFGRYVRRNFVYSSLRGSAIVGQINSEGLFMVSHQAPVSHRDMVGLLTKLSKDNSVRVVFAVTSDMVSMLERLGFRNQHQTINTEFRGVVVEKHLLTNF